MDLRSLSDEELLERIDLVALRERSTTAEVVEHLAEIDRREIFPHGPYASLFEYCLHHLKMSEGGAYKRIRAARACRAHHPLLGMLRGGRLTLESLVMLNPHVVDADIEALAEKACGLRSRQLEALLAERRKENPVLDLIRFGAARPAAKEPEPEDSLFSPREADPAAGRERAPASSVPTRPAADPDARLKSIRFAFTADEGFYRLLSVARSLLRHKYPDGRLEGVLGDALKALIERRDPLLRWKASARRRKPSV